MRRTRTWASATWIVVLFAGAVTAQDAGVPPDPRVIPAGHGWWCYELAEGAPDAGILCVRSRPTCESDRVADAHDGVNTGECVRRRTAWCVSTAETAAAPPRAVCSQTRALCLQEVRNARARHAARVSDCAEIP